MKLPIRGIKTGKVRTRTVFVYIMHEDRRVGIPSKTYVDVCSEGYRDFGFDRAVLSEAFQTSLEECRI